MQTKDFLVLGHPRCGTQYISWVLTELGFPVGHEKMEKYGISSWMFAVNDNNIPYSHDNSKRSDYNFRNIIHILRNPVNAISSIVANENAKQPSVNFRKKYICMFGNEIQQAVMSYVGWNKLIRAQKPDLTIRIEDEIEKIVDYLKFNGYNLTEEPSEEKINKLKGTVIHKSKRPQLSRGNIESNVPKDLFEQLAEIYYIGED